MEFFRLMSSSTTSLVHFLDAPTSIVRDADWPDAGLPAAGLWPDAVDRRSYLELAEELHPGVSGPRVCAKWLAETPLPPVRFLPMLQARWNHAA